MNRSNIILIGMPGSGKSTIGGKLAVKMSKTFLDTDLLIEASEKRSLQNIIDTHGYKTLLEIEENTLLHINQTDHIISTGGSAVYSEKAMSHLKKKGIMVFLDVHLEILQKRIDNLETRGLARRPDQSLEDLFYERHHLYRKYAEITVDNSCMTSSEACDAVLKEIDDYSFL